MMASLTERSLNAEFTARFTLVLDLRIFTFLFHISGGYEPAPVVWVVAVLVGVCLFVCCWAFFWF